MGFYLLVKPSTQNSELSYAVLLIKPILSA